jgi:small subunit ribosomal protein S1
MTFNEETNNETNQEEIINEQEETVAEETQEETSGTQETPEEEFAEKAPEAEASEENISTEEAPEESVEEETPAEEVAEEVPEAEASKEDAPAEEGVEEGTREEKVAEEALEAEASEEDAPAEEAVEEETPEEEVTKEALAEPMVDYLSSNILSVRTVTKEDIEEKDDEEKFELHEDLMVNVKRNNIVHGNVVNVSDRDVFIDIGFKTEGIVPLSEFKNPPIIGKELEVVVEKFEDMKGNLVLSKEKADFIKRWANIRDAYENETLIKGVIIRRIKGGMVVDLDVIQAFLPGSQIDIKPVTDFDEYIGKEFEFKIVKLNELRKNVVLSRKEILASDLQEKRKDILKEMQEGMVLEGIVKNITDFGAFINLGGIDGLLHITDITWGRINHPSEKLEIGQTVEVKVIDFDLEKVRVSLGMKQLTKEPWADIDERFPVATEVEGKVVNMMNYGLFIELEEGVEGLIHISEISWTKHIKHPSDIYTLGEMVNAKVLSVEKSEKKISLGVKQLTSNPWDDIESSYKIGDIKKGIVKNITQFGAFINLDDSIDGLLHISDMSWTKTIRHPKDFLSMGDEVGVKILEVSSEEKKISLGVKQLEENPWDTLSDEFSSGKKIKGKAIQVIDKGVIFDLDHNVEGLLETRDKDNYKIGEEYDLLVQGIDSDSKKVIIMDNSDPSEKSEAKDESSDATDEVKEENLVEEAAEETPSEEETLAAEETPSEDGDETESSDAEDVTEEK